MTNQKRFFTLFAILWLVMAAVWWSSPPVSAAPAAQTGGGRLVIKNGEVAVEVTDTDTAVNAALNLALTYNAYVLQQRVWDGENNYRYAEIQFGVPVAEFENLARDLKTLGVVQDETATGQDVTDATTDLESQLANLYETQARMRTFLEQARTVTETLRIHQELVDIETQIGTLQGNVNYYIDRAASATLLLRLLPFIPTPTPFPTSTPTPTPTPTGLPAANPWHPGDTAQIASVRLTNTFFNLSDFFLYRLIVCGPWLLVFGLVAIPAWRVYRRLEPAKRPFPPPPPAPETAENPE